MSFVYPYLVVQRDDCTYRSDGFFPLNIVSWLLGLLKKQSMSDGFGSTEKIVSAITDPADEDKVFEWEVEKNGHQENVDVRNSLSRRTTVSLCCLWWRQRPDSRR